MSKVTLARLAVAAMALALVLLPGEVWSRPPADLEKQGFDPQLHYRQPRSRQAFDPFLVLENGTWEPCPCPPGTHLAIVGQGLAERTAKDPEGALRLAGTRVLVNGAPALVFLVTPSQVNFLLPEQASGPVATLSLEVEGQIRGEDTVGLELDAGDEEGQQVQMRKDVLALQALPGREPAVHLITTPLSFRTSFVARVGQQSGSSVPLRVMLWNPRNFSDLSLVFSADRQIEAILSENRGQVTRRYDLGTYELDRPYRVSLEWRRGKEATVSLTGPAGTRSARVRSEDSLALFDAYRPSLSVMASGRDGGSFVSLSDYRLTLLPERFTTIRVSDDKILPIMLLVAIAGASTLVIPSLTRPAWREAGKRWLSLLFGFRQRLSALPRRPVALFAGAAMAFLGINALLFGLGSHPFDMGAQTIWTYIAVQHGLPDLYYLAQTATLAGVWDGTPYHEAVFPYNIGMAYYFWSIGLVHQLFFGHVFPDSQSLAVMIKSFNLAFMVLDAALVYAILRTLRPSARLLPWVALGLLLFNPAFVFDVAVWGETEAVPLFFLLASLLAALKQRPNLAWSLLGLAFLTKQTVLIAVLVLGIYYLFRFSWRDSLQGLSAAAILGTIISLPFSLNGYPPSIAIDPTLAIAWVHGGTGAERVFQVVSYDAFNVWPLITFWRDGAQGLGRLQFPDHVPVWGGLSYHDFGNALLALLVLALIAWMIVQRKRVRTGQPWIYLAVAVVFLAGLVLPTRPVSRYFLFPLAFTLFGFAGRWRWAAVLVFASLSLTTLVGIYGSLASALEAFPRHAPFWAPQNNPLSQAALYLFRSDTFITLASVLNLASLFVLAGVLWLESRRPLERKSVVPALYPAPGQIAVPGGSGGSGA